MRAIVEEGRFAIDDFLVYKRDPASPGGNELVRLPLDHAEYTWQGKRRLLAWVDMTYSLYPVTAPSSPDVEATPMIEECNSGDIGYVTATGHFHPNKPPGTSFFAVPAYFLIYHIERWMGINPDHWWPLTVNAWLTSALSVGIISALGCMLVFRFGREVSDGRWLPALLAALALGFGTTYFPFGTLLFDHNLTATLLFASFFCLWRVGQKSHLILFGMLAGFCAGLAALTNYIAAGAGVFLGLYALFATTGRREEARNQQLNLRGLLYFGRIILFLAMLACVKLPKPYNYVAAIAAVGLGAYVIFSLREFFGDFRRWNWSTFLYFSLGVLPVFLLLCYYNVINFHDPFKLANDFQNPLFKDTGAFLGMFNLPRAYVAGLLTVSPYRGIFLLAPVTVMRLYGIVRWLRERKFAAEARLCLAIFGFFLLVNVCFNGYHGGFAAGPRYLVPGLPFLALPLVVAFQRWKIITIPLLVVSVGQQLLLTATDAQNSLAVGGHARIDDAHRKDDFFCQIVGEYAWPLFAYGRAWPVLDTLIKVRLEEEATDLETEGVPESERPARIAALDQRLRESVAKATPEIEGEKPMILAAIKGPVSVNPIGAYDGLLLFRDNNKEKQTGGKTDPDETGAFFPANSMQTDWNSFNVGEFLWKESRRSLLPLLLMTGGLCGFLIWRAARRDREQFRLGS